MTKPRLVNSPRKGGVLAGLVALVAILVGGGFTPSPAFESMSEASRRFVGEGESVAGARQDFSEAAAARRASRGIDKATAAERARRAGLEDATPTTTAAQPTTTAPTTTQAAAATVTTRAATTPTTGSTAPKTTGSAPTTAATAVTTTTTTRPTAAPPPNHASLTVGWTHAQFSADAWFDRAAVASAENVLRAAAPMQNQHIFGFGVLNPEPAPGVFDWASLDQRMALIRRTGATPVITLCCAPDWMKGGAPGSTDWGTLEKAPNPANFDDFARLSAEVAKRYPDVKHFLVWNEMKGFWNNAQNRWDYEGYTAMYNKVYTAVKAVRPDALIGGPYVVVDTWPSANTSNPSALTGPWGVFDQRPLDVINYWNHNKIGGDFVVLDGGIVNKNYTITTDPVTAASKLETITRWAKQTTGLPVWWAELYPIPPGNLSDVQEADATMVALDYIAKGGGSVALLWGPNGTGDCWGCLFGDVRYPGGGQPSLVAQRLIARK